MSRDNMTPPQWIRDAWNRAPDKSDLLFLTPEQWEAASKDEIGPWKGNASLHDTNGEPNSEAYATGYRRAAQILAGYAVERGYETSILVYPIVFLYRHAVELRLKRSIPLAASLVDDPLREDEKPLLGNHRLDQLWAILRSRLRRIRQNRLCEISEDQITGIDSYIQQLSKIDEQSFSFRYAHAKDGTTPTLGHLKHINIGRTTILMERLVSSLTGFDEWLHDRYQDKCESLAEAYQEPYQGDYEYDDY